MSSLDKDVAFVSELDAGDWFICGVDEEAGDWFI